MNVSEITLRRLNLPLKIPYKLAFGPVTAFDTILVTVTGDNGEEGFGEATILTGYTPETVDGAWAKARELAAALKGMEAATAKAEALKHHKAAPFTVTSLVTAIEMAEGSPFLEITRETPVPLLAIRKANPGRWRATQAAKTPCQVKTCSRFRRWMALIMVLAARSGHSRS